MIRYSVTNYFGKALVVLDDPVFSRPWYLASYRNGQYKWTQNTLFARALSINTALKHMIALNNGAQADEWKAFSDMWKAAFQAARKED